MNCVVIEYGTESIEILATSEYYDNVTICKKSVFVDIYLDL
jgi:hypothetical protein